MDRKIGNLTFRELVGIALLILLLLSGLLSSWYMEWRNTQIAQELDNSAWLALSGQWQKARDTADAAKEQWEQSWDLWATLSDHTPMEEINSLFGELEIYGAAGERTDFARGCAVLASRLTAMANANKFCWWNVL